MEIIIDDNHHYIYGEKKFPSVTTVISETVGIGWSAPEWYLTRGKAVHACAALIAQGKKFKHDEQIDGQVRAIQRFFQDLKPVVLFFEKPVVSNVFGFGGTIDLLAEIGEVRYIIDYKASIDPIRLQLQLGGYSQALKDCLDIDVRLGLGVQIKDDGTYKCTEKIDLKFARKDFISLLTTYKIKEKCK